MRRRNERPPASEAGKLSASPAPRVGQFRLARSLTTILPAMSLAEALEPTRIHRIAGRTGRRTACVTTRPCRAPHQPMADVGLIGGGQVPIPGEVSRVHHGVLFLDARPRVQTAWA